jgi:hypothetical protein
MSVQISDGGTTPHATDYEDLLVKLKAFALANGWVSVEDTSDKLVLQGEGSGTDEIFVGIQKYENIPGDSYGWHLQGYSGYVDGLTFDGQPGAIPHQVNTNWNPSVPLWDTTIPYWFVGDGRRLIVVAKISTVYVMAYLGFYLPFASPNQYPYPLAVGGSYANYNSIGTPRWSLTGDAASAFFTALNTTGSSLQVRTVDSTWRSWKNDSLDNSLNIEGYQSSGMYPYNQPDAALLRQALDDSPVLTPIEIVQAVNGASSSVPPYNRLGELDGIYHISGFGQAAENIVTIDAVDYLIVPNVYRSSVVDYCALRLS